MLRLGLEEQAKRFLSQTEGSERRSPGKRAASSQQECTKRAHLEVATPKREALLLTPSALVQVGGSPYSKRYLSTRKIDFVPGGSRRTHSSSKRLSFFK